MITFLDIAALSPLLIVLMGSLLMLLIECFVRSDFSKKVAFTTMTGILLLGLIATLLAPPSENPLLTPWLRFDNLARVFNFLFLVISLAVTLLTYPFFRTFAASSGEYFFLNLAALFGLC